MSADAIETSRKPELILRSFMGALTLSTKDLCEELQHAGFAYQTQIDFGDVYQKEHGDICISNMYEPDKKIHRVMSCRQFDHGAALASNANFSINSSGGRKSFTVKDFAKRWIDNMNMCKYAISPADEVPFDAGSKRCGKALERTMRAFNELRNIISSSSKENKNNDSQQLLEDSKECELGLYGVAVPSYTESANDDLPVRFCRSMQMLLEAGAEGIVVGGAGQGESTEQLSSVLRAITAENMRHHSQVSKEAVPVLVQGMDTLEQVLVCLLSGVDQIATNLPHILTTHGLALNVVHDINSIGDTPALGSSSKASPAEGIVSSESASVGVQSDVAEQPLDSIEPSADISNQTKTSRKRKATSFSESIGPLGDNHDEENMNGCGVDGKPRKEVAGARYPCPAMKCVLHMGAATYSRDKSPMVSGCQCHACKHFTRGYIRHLITAKELLGDVLLFAHNTFQLLSIVDNFHKVRETGQGSDSTKFIEYIRQQI